MIQFFKTNKIFFITSILFVVFILSGCTQKSSENNSDPLGQLLGFSSEMSADFVTSIISPFSGDKNEFSSCISSAPISSQAGKIYALVNSANLDEMLDKKHSNDDFIPNIKKEIDPILGHAFKNSELNWHWNEHVRDSLKKSDNDTQYIFTSVLGEEPFWYCYFTTGPQFFKDFFYSDTVVYDTHDENFTVSIADPLTGNSLKGFAPWGASVSIATENGQSCETWADNENEFNCTFSENFTEQELVTADIIAPDGTPYRVQKRQGNAKSLDCSLGSGMLGECQVR